MDKLFKDEMLDKIIKSVRRSRIVEEPALLEGYLDELEKSLDLIVENTSKEIILKCEYVFNSKIGKDHNGQMEQKISELKRGANLNSKLFIQKKHLINSYQTMHSAYRDITNERKIIADLDRSEKWRFFLFRMLTAVGIAGVILATSYIAHNILCIPLPFSSRLSP